MRVRVLREVRAGVVGEPQLCFQWCCYVHDDRTAEYGYRFVWRSGDGATLPSRGQARIPSLAAIAALTAEASARGWGDRDGAAMTAAAERLHAGGYAVDLAAGYVGFRDRAAARQGYTTPAVVADAKLIQSWS
jgi:hypothetical protein